MKTESDYRVTYEVAKLMKQADYKEKATACYVEANTSHMYQEGLTAFNFNARPNWISAPIIPMALDWAESLGYNYEIDKNNMCYKLKKNHIPVDNFKPQDFTNSYLTAVCNHIINNK